MSDMKKQAEDVKDQLAARLALYPAVGTKMAVNWAGLVDSLDGALQRYLPVLGPLAPPQVAALANLIASGVHLADQALHGDASSNPYSPNP